MPEIETDHTATTAAQPELEPAQPKVHGIAHLATRIFGTPLLIAPEKFEVIMRVLGPRLGIVAQPMPMQPTTIRRKPYEVTPDGIAVIPIEGTLVHKSYGMEALSGLQSYADLQAQIEDAATDPAIKGILLDCDSPGGELAGAFDLADTIYQARAAKPIYAVADNDAFSAAYLLASSADRIYATRTSGLGSIGVIASHVDMTGADAQDGLKYTVISAGSQKADFNPHVPLSQDAMDRMRARVMQAYRMLVDAVARNRGMSPKAVGDTEAGLYFGENAVKANLADQLGTRQDALNGLRAAISGTTGRKGKMEQQTTQPEASVAAPTVEAKETKPEPELGALAEARSTAFAEAAEIADLCALAGLPGETVALLKQGATSGEARDHMLKRRAAASYGEIDGHVAPASNRNPSGTEKDPKGTGLMVQAVERLIAHTKQQTAARRPPNTL